MKKIKRIYLLFIFLGVILIFFSSCSSVDPVREKHTFEAAINVKQSIKNFEKVKFEPYEDLSLGFYKGKVWINLRIHNANQPSSYMVINNDLIGRNYTFYKLDSLTNSYKLVNQREDQSKLDHRTFNFSNPNFKIDLDPNEKASFIIETISDGRTVDATPKLITMASYFAFTNENMIWSIIFLGIIGFLILLNIYQWSIHKQRVYFYCVFYMLSTFLMYIGLEGHLYNFEIDHHIIDHVIFLSIRLWVLSLLMYTAVFLDIKEIAPTFYSFVKWLLMLIIGGTTIYQFTYYDSSIAFLHYFDNTLSFLWLLIIFVTVLLSAKKRKLELTYYLIPLSSFLLLTTIGLIDGHFQVFPGTPFIYIKIGTVIEFTGFTYFMSVLIKRRIRKTEKLESELQITNERLIEKDKLLKSKSNSKKTDLISIFKILENSLSNEAEWNEFKTKFNELSPSFLEHLMSTHPELSKADIRLLTLIRIGYSQKEIASILNIAPDSVKKAKNRVRKKLLLPETTILNEYLDGL